MQSKRAYTLVLYKYTMLNLFNNRISNTGIFKELFIFNYQFDNNMYTFYIKVNKKYIINNQPEFIYI